MAKRKNRPAKQPAAILIEHGRNTEVDMTPAHLRRHPWTLRAASPGYHGNSYAGDDSATMHPVHDGCGFKFDLEQWGSEETGNPTRLYRRCVYVSGWAAGMPAHPGQPNTINDLTLSGIIEIQDLENFARGLLAAVEAVRAKHPEMRGRY